MAPGIKGKQEKTGRNEQYGFRLICQHPYLDRTQFPFRRSGVKGKEDAEISTRSQDRETKLLSDNALRSVVSCCAVNPLICMCYDLTHPEEAEVSHGICSGQFLRAQNRSASHYCSYKFHLKITLVPGRGLMLLTV